MLQYQAVTKNAGARVSGEKVAISFAGSEGPFKLVATFCILLPVSWHCCA